MATNKKKILVTESMSNQGRALLNARDDIELVEFPNMISAKDFEAKLREHAPVHGVALGGTRFGGPLGHTLQVSHRDAAVVGAQAIERRCIARLRFG